MDIIDKKILALLRKDARISISELSRKVHLSRTAVQERVSRLEKDGIITGYTIKHTQGSISAIILLKHNSTRRTTTQIADALAENANVRECFIISGQFDMLINVECSTLSDIDEIMTSIDSLQTQESSFVIETITYPIIKKL